MFDFWLFVLLAGAGVFLWRRVDRLETELREISLCQAHAPRAVAPDAGAVPATRGTRVEEPEVEAGPDFSPPETIAYEQPESTPAEPPSAAELAAPRFSLKFDFEDLFGRLLPIWAGGVALAVAGF